jgi:ribosomal protein S1
MTWSRGTHPSAVVEAGQTITLVVLHADHGNEKITLGLKQLQADPWLRVNDTYQVGATHTGRVTRIAPFGVFVELEPGIEALAHASTFTGSPDSWSSGLKAGMPMTVEILTIDAASRRIAVSPATGGVTPETADDVRAYAERQKSAGGSFGSLADKLRGALGSEKK